MKQPLIRSRRVIGLFGLILLIGACSASADVAQTHASVPLPTVQDQEPAALGAAPGFDPQGGAFTGPSLTSLNQRTAGTIAIRLFSASLQMGDTACDPTNQECVPSWCVPQGTLVVELSNQAMVATREALVIGLASGSRMSVLSDEVVGVSEHSPVQLAVVRVATDVARVRLSSPGGDDSAVPANGFVALAVPGSGVPATLRALDKDGQPLQTVGLADGPTVNSAACQAAPIQPPKAGTPPADPKTAEASIRAAFQTAYTSVPGSPYAGLERVEGGPGLHTTLDEARKNFPEAANTMTVTTANLVFTSPTTAAVEYTLTYTGGAEWGTKYGRAVLVDGSWVVSRDTFCALLAFGGGTCPKA